MAEIAQKTQQATAHRSDIARFTQLMAQKELRAPIDGIVQDIKAVTVGGVVAPADTIASVVPDDAPLVVEALLANKDVGYVRAGQTADVHVDTFPFQRYGSIAARVVWVSPDASGSAANDMKQAGAANAAAAASYRMLVQPEAAALTIGGRQEPMRPGMTVQVDVHTDRRRPIEFLLDPITRLLHEGTRTR